MPETLQEALQIPGAAVTLAVAFILGFLLSQKASLWWQVGVFGATHAISE